MSKGKIFKSFLGLVLPLAIGYGLFSQSTMPEHEGRLCWNSSDGLAYNKSPSTRCARVRRIFSLSKVIKCLCEQRARQQNNISQGVDRREPVFLRLLDFQLIAHCPIDIIYAPCTSERNALALEINRDINSEFTRETRYLAIADEFSQRVVDDFVTRRYQIREGVTCVSHTERKIRNEYI